MTPQGMNLSRLSAVALLGSAMTTLAGPTNIPSITVNPYLPAAVSPGRVFLAVALWYFRRTERNFADIL